MACIKKYKVYCDNCGFDTTFTQNGFFRLEKWEGEAICPICKQGLDVKKL